MQSSTSLPLNLVPNDYLQNHPLLPPPSFDYHPRVEARRPLPPVILTAITPCCGNQYQADRLLSYVNKERSCPAGHALDPQRVILVQNPVGVVNIIHERVAPRQLSLLDRLWNGVKTVARFAVKLTIGAFKILWEIVKVALRIGAYYLLGAVVVAVILNPTPASIVVLGALALLIATTDRAKG